MEDAYSWHEQFYYFALFRALNGPDATPSKENEAPINNETSYTQADLSAWICEQNHARKAFLDGRVSNITADQVRTLDSVSFPWIRDSTERWDGHFCELVAFKEEHGHCNVPVSSGKLGTWVKNQRAAYQRLWNMAATGGGRDGKAKKTTAVITLDQIKLLTDLGFQWKMRAEHADAWNARYERLKVFWEKHGHCRITTVERPSLGRWVWKMRKLYKERADGLNSRITDEQITKLEDIGFEWEKGPGDPEEKKRKKEEASKKKNEKRRLQRAKSKMKKDEELEAASKKLLEEAMKRRGSLGRNMEEELVATRPKENADRDLDSVDQITNDTEANPEADRDLNSTDQITDDTKEKPEADMDLNLAAQITDSTEKKPKADRDLNSVNQSTYDTGEKLEADRDLNLVDEMTDDTGEKGPGVPDEKKRKKAEANRRRNERRKRQRAETRMQKQRELEAASRKCSEEAKKQRETSGMNQDEDPGKKGLNENAYMDQNTVDQITDDIDKPGAEEQMQVQI